MPAALVIGPTSMLGGRLAEQLRADGWTVHTAGRGAGCDVALDLGRESWEGSLPFGADVVFHCASAFGDDSPAGAWSNEQVNALGAHQVVALARAAGCGHLVYAGSTSSCQTGPASGSYGASKARGEDILRAGLSRHGIGFASLRFAQLYDERAVCIRHQAWLGRIVAYAREGRPLRMPAGESLRNFVHVIDAARWMVAVAIQRLAGIMVASHPCAQSYGEIARLAFAVFDRGGGAEIAGEKPPFRPVLIPAPALELQDIGVLPLLSMRDGMTMIRDAGFAHLYGPMDVG